MEFLLLRQIERTSMEVNHARFFMLERFAPSNFSSERERAAEFVSELRISLRAMVATFSYSTLAEAVMRALECEHARDSHHQAKGTRPLVARVIRTEHRISGAHNDRGGWWSGCACC